VPALVSQRAHSYRKSPLQVKLTLLIGGDWWVAA